MMFGIWRTVASVMAGNTRSDRKQERCNAGASRRLSSGHGTVGQAMFDLAPDVSRNSAVHMFFSCPPWRRFQATLHPRPRLSRPGAKKKGYVAAGLPGTPRKKPPDTAMTVPGGFYSVRKEIRWRSPAYRASARSIRASTRFLPMTAMVSKSPGLAVPPVMATRMGWASFLNLSSLDSR